MAPQLRAWALEPDHPAPVFTPPLPCVILDNIWPLLLRFLIGKMQLLAVPTSEVIVSSKKIHVRSLGQHLAYEKHSMSVANR